VEGRPLSSRLQWLQRRGHVGLHRLHFNERVRALRGCCFARKNVAEHLVLAENGARGIVVLIDLPHLPGLSRRMRLYSHDLSDLHT
jgi:hypothetical protein